jgi:hypothetical protein
MTEWTGIPRATYARLGRGQIKNPSLRALVNCALVLRLDLDDLIEEEWRTWMQLGPHGPRSRPRALPRRQPARDPYKDVPDTASDD